MSHTGKCNTHRVFVQCLHHHSALYGWEKGSRHHYSVLFGDVVLHVQKLCQDSVLSISYTLHMRCDCTTSQQLGMYFEHTRMLTWGMGICVHVT